MTVCLLQTKSPGAPGTKNMNTLNTESSAPRSRRRAVFAALLVALVGLTIAPGFECTHKEPDGSETTVKMEE